uniref:Uncharacterized protein n=1 Tax=Schizaphis graminum TaxID=13262 RepID=A0A2S2NCR1_SCHGA
MGTSTIPISWYWFWIKCYHNTKLFGNTVQYETSHPQMITNANTFTWSNLEFPLSWHNFGVLSRYVDSGVQTCTIMSLHNVTSVHFISADTAIVRSLYRNNSAN